MARIGFVGLGRMGGPMARNLLKAGHVLKVYDNDLAALARFDDNRAEKARSLAEAAAGAEFIVSMVPAGPNVREAYLAADGLIAAAAKGTVLLDCSTIDVATAKQVAARAREAGLAMLDAPVTGGVPGAVNGTLTIMCGGDAATFAKAKPILAGMGRNILHAGESGMGQAVKICNNLVSGCTMVLLGEAFALAERLGLSARTLFEVMSTGTANSWILNHLCPVPGMVADAPANRDFQANFTSTLMLKDLRLAQTAGERSGAPTPMVSTAISLFQLHANAGGADLDPSSIIALLRGPGA
jgi:3-hydroxyisobutyrate dehydrogenase